MSWRSSLIAICVLLGVGVPSASHAQNNEQIATGDSALRQFVYQGKPIHPFCIEFPLERSSRSQPINLDDCGDPSASPRQDKNGWLTADHRDAGQTLRGMYASYKVLARKGNQFLIATSVCGGGSGIFDSLMWVQLQENQIRIISEEPGGDRCSGGIADDYQIDGATIRFSRFVTPVDIIELAGIKPESVREGLEQTPVSCFGRADYLYDLPKRASKLVSVRLHAGFSYPENNHGKAEGDWTRNAANTHIKNASIAYSTNTSIRVRPI